MTALQNMIYFYRDITKFNIAKAPIIMHRSAIISILYQCHQHLNLNAFVNDKTTNVLRDSCGVLSTFSMHTVVPSPACRIMIIGIGCLNDNIPGNAYVLNHSPHSKSSPYVQCYTFFYGSLKHVISVSTAQIGQVCFAQVITYWIG